MGASSLPPRLTIPEALRTIDSVTHHSDAALMVVDIPWDALLADSSPSLLIRRDQFPVAQLYQQRGLPLVATLDATNGLNRSAESDALVKLGRSIAEPAVKRKVSRVRRRIRQHPSSEVSRARDGDEPRSHRRAGIVYAAP